MRYVQAVVGENKFLVQYEYGHKKEKSYVLISDVRSKEDACLEIDEPI